MTIKFVQPRQIGSKKGKSLILCIPANIAKEYQIGPNSLFIIRVDPNSGDLIFQKFNYLENQSLLLPDNECGQNELSPIK